MVRVRVLDRKLAYLIVNFVMGSLFSFSVDLVCFSVTGQGI